MQRGALPQVRLSTRAISCRVPLALALATVSSQALAHGEDVLVSIGLQALSFFGCIVALGMSKYLKSHWLAAAGGALLGLATFVWPLGAIPYRENARFLNTAAVLACPLLMLVAHSLARWWRGRLRAQSST
jgi:hypothetical protein